MDEKYAQQLLEESRKNYNLIAKDFSSTRSLVWEELRFLGERVNSGEKVLDLGCGNGRLLSLFLDKEIEYFGVDNSEELIRIARAKYPGNNFQAANAFNLPFPDNFFDKVLSIAVLHHIPSKELRSQFLKEVKRVLKPGGLFISTVWRFHRLQDLFLIVKFSILKLLGLSKLDFGDIFTPWGKKAKRYYHIFSKKELMDSMKSLGFLPKELKVIKNAKGNRQNIYSAVQKP